MASIRKRNGKYQARVTRQGWGSTAKTFTHRADAIRWARHTQILAEQGGIESPSRCLTLGALIDRYRLSVTPTKKNARTENLILKQWLQVPVVNRPLDRVRPQDIAAWRDQRLAEGLSSGTVRNYLATLSAVYRHAQTEWSLNAVANPVMMIRRPSPTRARTRRVAEDEVEAIKKATLSPHLSDLIDLAIETAMRLGELVSIRPNMVDFAARTVTLKDSKNGHGRVVPLSTVAIGILQKRSSNKLFTDRLFPISSHSATVAFKRAVVRARNRLHQRDSLPIRSDFLTDLRFHDLRREATTRFFEKGLDLVSVSSITGHRVAEMVKRYTAFHASDLAEKLDRQNPLLKNNLVC